MKDGEWTKEHLGPESPFAGHFLFWAIRDSYSRLAFVPGEVDADRIISDHNVAARVAGLERALEHATWMNRWQFDEHRTGAYGALKDEASCRCDWCKTYRDTRYENLAARSPTETVTPEETE